MEIKKAAENFKEEKVEEEKKCEDK